MQGKDASEIDGPRRADARAARDRQIIESVTEFAIIAMDREGLVTDWNTGAERILGWSLVEMTGRSVQTFFTAEDRAAGQMEREMRACLVSGRAIDERWHLRKDGSRFWASGEMMPLRDEAGGHIGFVKVLRDRTDRHRQGEALAASQAALVSSEAKWRNLFSGLREGFILGKVVRDDAGRIVDWLYEEVNRAWGELVGVPAEQAAGRTIRDLFPGIEDAWVNEFADVVETGVPIRFTRQVGTIERWYDGVCQPIGEDRFTVLFLEVTDRVRAEKLRAALSELSESLLLEAGAETMAHAASVIVGRTLGVARAGYGSLGGDGETLTISRDWVADGIASVAGVHRLTDYGAFTGELRQGLPVVVSDTHADPRTAPDAPALDRLGVRAMIDHPIVEHGRTVATLFVNASEPRAWTSDELGFMADAANRVRSAVERRQAEAALRASDERYRTFVENVDVGICTIEVIYDETGRPVDYLYLDANPAMETQAGLVDVVGRRVREFVPDLEPYWPELYGRVAISGVSEHVQYELKGLGRWFDIRAFKVGAPNERRVAVLFSNVTDRVEAEKRRDMLNQELAHRLKNTLAVVQSIATQTLRSAPDLATARDSLTKRIQAMSKAHDILLTGKQDAGAVEAVIRGAVALHDPDGRIVLRGPDLQIGSKAALTLALIMHELSTNAAKYGALSVPHGKVQVEWAVEVNEGPRVPMLVMTWIEIDGPPAEPPARKGFGTRLIEMGLSGSAGSAVELDYAPNGFRCRITASLLDIQADED